MWRHVDDEAFQVNGEYLIRAVWQLISHLVKKKRLSHTL